MADKEAREKIEKNAVEIYKQEQEESRKKKEDIGKELDVIGLSKEQIALVIDLGFHHANEHSDPPKPDSSAYGDARLFAGENHVDTINVSAGTSAWSVILFISLFSIDWVERDIRTQIETRSLLQIFVSIWLSVDLRLTKFLGRALRRS